MYLIIKIRKRKWRKAYKDLQWGYRIAKKLKIVFIYPDKTWLDGGLRLYLDWLKARNTNMLTMLGFNEVRFFEMMCPDRLKSRSEATLVAQIESNFLASCLMFGNSPWCRLHHSRTSSSWSACRLRKNSTYTKHNHSVKPRPNNNLVLSCLHSTLLTFFKAFL